MRLNSQTGTDGLPACSLNCDRPLRSGIRALETVVSTGGQITDSVMPYAPHQSLAPEPAVTSPEGGQAIGHFGLSRHMGMEV